MRVPLTDAELADALRFDIAALWQTMQTDRLLVRQATNTRDREFWRGWAEDGEVRLRTLLAVRALARTWRANGVRTPCPECGHLPACHPRADVHPHGACCQTLGCPLRVTA